MSKVVDEALIKARLYSAFPPYLPLTACLKGEIRESRRPHDSGLFELHGTSSPYFFGTNCTNPATILPKPAPGEPHSPGLRTPPIPPSPNFLLCSSPGGGLGTDQQKGDPMNRPYIAQRPLGWRLLRGVLPMLIAFAAGWTLRAYSPWPIPGAAVEAPVGAADSEEGAAPPVVEGGEKDAEKSLEAEREELVAAEVFQKLQNQILEEDAKKPEALVLKEIRELAATEPNAALLKAGVLLGRLDANAPKGHWGLAEQAILALVPAKSGAVDTWLYQLFDADELMTQIPAARALELRGDTRALGQLVTRFGESFQSPDVETRVQAVTNLSRTQSPRVLPLLEAAALDPVAEVRLRVAKGLYFIRDAKTLDVGRQLLEDTNAQVRAAAQEAIDRQREESTS